MNYLAHLHVAEQTPEGLVASLMGDFVKGPLSTELPRDIYRGIRLHRLVDQFTDAHPIHLRSRSRFQPPRRRFAGIIVDVCYDHFLARSWEQFSQTPLPAFTEHVYRLLHDHRAMLPATLQRIAPRMAERDWLSSYADMEMLGRALDGIATRSRRIAPIAGALTEVRLHYAGLRADFSEFFPALVTFAEAAKHSGQLRPSK